MKQAAFERQHHADWQKEASGKGDQAQDRTKDLFAGVGHLVGHIGKDGWLDIVAALESGRLADAARNMQVAVGAPDRLASASPVQVTPGVNNAGGMSIEGLYAVSPSVYPIADVTLTFQADGSFTTSADPSTVYTYTPGKAIEINGWSLTLRGSPAAGDSFTIGAALPGSTPQNGGNAKAVLALRDQATFDGVALSDGYGSLLSHLGTSVQGAKFEASFSSQVASSSDKARAAVSGVNLDEEAARLLAPLADMLEGAGMRSGDAKAGCGKCGACSSLSSFERK